ncbi:3-deoxy-D-manno-octulosonic acid transferase [Candidatus Pelagibacter sp.]|uniref:3-deoxy-D-manno-octulosonic acid transferase n=1 Tax=Candidatus Pelagibacter sp. TaxID=2024849 RepID=UPI003F82A654
MIRLIKRKENIKRFIEKFGFFTKKRISGKLIWFHGASVGEIQSIIPLIERLEKDRKINQILITSNTLSSSIIINKLNLRKTIHQFFPIDCNFISSKFLDYWKPSKVFFVDSEIWPNTINNLFEKNIPIILLNGRITKKTFNRWMKFSNFSKFVFSKFNYCLSANEESKKLLKKLGANNVKFFGNLKFSQSENQSVKVDKNLKKFLLKRNSWCASSTHYNEEKFCGLAHLKLKKKYKNLLTIIIPRHVDRVHQIKTDLNKLNLNVHLDHPKEKIKPNTDIYLVNSYGKTKSIFKICKNVFLGGSLINHGGQNPLEAARYGCCVFHGPHVSNFKEIYEHLQKKEISFKVKNQNHLTNLLQKKLDKKNFSKKSMKNLSLEGIKILNKIFNEIC